MSALYMTAAFIFQLLVIGGAGTMDEYEEGPRRDKARIMTYSCSLIALIMAYLSGAAA